MEHPFLGGQYLGIDTNHSDRYFVESKDTHSIIIGATRSGKSRCIALQTLCIQALAEESMIISDPKGELYLYSHKFLKSLGYEVIALDFKNPLKSCQYNFLQPVIDAVNIKDIPLAIKRTRDIVASLAQSDGLEQIWQDGQRAMLVCAILAVVYDNQNHPEYQNLTNAFHFLGKMCASQPGVKEELPIIQYLKNQPDNHPAKASIDISNIAPAKMRGSFYTSAITTLELFIDPNIYSMTCDTEFDIYTTGITKRAIFIILPDHYTTYHPLASLFVNQQYQLLVDCSDEYGNRLPRRVNFNLDEFGNFTKIPDFATAITVGGGRGIRFNLYLQDFNQMDEKYGKESSATIRSNCETWIYLQTDNADTLEELSQKLGTYTIKTSSLSSSTGGNMSASYNLASRPLLFPSEIRNIHRPYILVFSRNSPAMMYAPDISQTIFNKLLGLGDEKYNQQLIMRRQAERPVRPVQSILIWKPWEDLQKIKTEKRRSFAL